MIEPPVTCSGPGTTRANASGDPGMPADTWVPDDGLRRVMRVTGARQHDDTGLIGGASTCSGLVGGGAHAITPLRHSAPRDPAQDVKVTFGKAEAFSHRAELDATVAITCAGGRAEDWRGIPKAKPIRFSRFLCKPLSPPSPTNRPEPSR